MKDKAQNLLNALFKKEPKKFKYKSKHFTKRRFDNKNRLEVYNWDTNQWLLWYVIADNVEGAENLDLTKLPIEDYEPSVTEDIEDSKELEFSSTENGLSTVDNFEHWGYDTYDTPTPSSDSSNLPSDPCSSVTSIGNDNGSSISFDSGGF